ncbi:DinB family protein [Aquibacillus halophilus]|uniref:DinB family protein n=1 Tax=Aquibacillus halophilus TaxID=930132 RepID=A0A6A8DEF8_9BACI|nr:DinB family protein [Aquibacillus halophilus]MRH44075.1 DinB family protein [Aquibacillus halophilus]
MISSYKQFEQMIDEVNKLKNFPESKLIEPIAEGKWSTREIIGHIHLWDQLIILQVIPSIDGGKVPEFPSFNSFNLYAICLLEDYKTMEVLDSFISTRRELLEKIAEVDLENKFIIGEETDKVYTPESLIQMFVEHDRHHLKQIEEVLKA